MVKMYEMATAAFMTAVALKRVLLWYLLCFRKHKKKHV